MRTLPRRPFARGLAGAGLLAHVRVPEFGGHLARYCQSVRVAREGVEQDREITRLETQIENLTSERGVADVRRARPSGAPVNDTKQCLKARGFVNAEIKAERPFKRLEGNRREWFERLDQPALRALPARRYEIATCQKCRVNIDYHVEVDAHYYSVPHSLARQEVWARITRHGVERLHGGKRVAAQAGSRLKGKHTTVAEHMPAAHRAHMEWTPGRLLNWGASVGPGAEAVVRHLLTNRPHPEMGYRACLGLLSLARKYGKPRLEAACQRALEHWHAWLQVATLADAILDRLVHQAHKLPVKGDPMRKRAKSESTDA